MTVLRIVEEVVKACSRRVIFLQKKARSVRANSHRCITQKWTADGMNTVIQSADSLYVG